MPVPTPLTIDRRRSTRTAACLAATALALLAGCATPGDKLQPGASVTEMQAVLGAPTGRYTLPDSGERYEYATGPYGDETWMVDADRQGRVTAVRQVLTEREFNRVALAGRDARALLTDLGRPSNRRPGGWQGGEVWSWRYRSPFCQWFQVSISTDGRVGSSAYTPDPLCDGDDRDVAEAPARGGGGHAPTMR